MKKFYFMLSVVLFSGSLVAQTTIITNVEKENKTSNVNVTTRSTSTSIVSKEPNNNPAIVEDNSNLIFTNTPDNPGPVYINTGNVEEDTKNYVNAKAIWIKENTTTKDNTETPK